ncbi:MAG TPA: hypothetical protein VNA25_20630 [Phycisphaerae bacterium]|nr:hypothetical protein [Phycisphaerae bacterium]
MASVIGRECGATGGGLAVLARVKKGWKTMRQIERTGKARANGECVSCTLEEKCPKAVVDYGWW